MVKKISECLTIMEVIFWAKLDLLVAAAVAPTYSISLRATEVVDFHCLQGRTLFNIRNSLHRSRRWEFACADSSSTQLDPVSCSSRRNETRRQSACHQGRNESNRVIHNVRVRRVAQK